ncbi:MAG: YdcF family protein [Armatimonadota bacterium]
MAVSVLVAATGYALREPLLQAAGDFLVVSDPPAPADAVIVIGGNGIERITAAKRLLENGQGQWLVVSGGPTLNGPNSAAVNRDEALAAGIPAERLLIDDRAESTVDNAEGTARVMAARGLRSGVVLTSPYHTRRTAVVFSKIFRRAGLRASVIAVDDGRFSIHRWWTRSADRRLVFREYVKLAAFLGGIR